MDLGFCTITYKKHISYSMMDIFTMGSGCLRSVHLGLGLVSFVFMSNVIGTCKCSYLINGHSTNGLQYQDTDFFKLL